jgi:hypothetical protein
MTMEGESATCSRVKWFWAWDAPKEEKWLERMAREGWFLVSGGIVFRFVRGTPSECRYRLDYRTESGQALSEYLGLCRDAGWEHVDRFANWHYFRCADPAAPELHTDPESLAASYKRLLVFLVILLVLNLGFSLNAHFGRSVGLDSYFQAIQWVHFGLVGLLTYGIFRISGFIRQLRASTRHRAL